VSGGGHQPRGALASSRGTPWQRIRRCGAAAWRIVRLPGAALLLLALLPETAFAWTPGTHVLLGDAVLRSLAALPAATAALLHAFPNDFLYGSIAADTSIAKKYAPQGRHCHSWNVGFEILERAGTDQLRAFALGYLAHLAADSVAHNYFVPRYLVVTSRTSAFGHSYWESRFEAHLGEGFAKRAREVMRIGHGDADAHLDRILSPTIFSTQTNRRIFRGMVHVTDSDSWQRIFQIAADNSRWDLTDPEVSRYLDRSYDFVMDFLIRAESSVPFSHDPSGNNALQLAKEVRRAARMSGVGFHVAEEAGRHFRMPEESQLGYASSLEAPLFPSARADSN
jgi:hypothetical protein